MLNTNFDSKFGKEGLTFDDVLLIPGESNVEPKNVDVTSNVELPLFDQLLNICSLTFKAGVLLVLHVPAPRPVLASSCAVATVATIIKAAITVMIRFIVL